VRAVVFGVCGDVLSSLIENGAGCLSCGGRALTARGRGRRVRDGKIRVPPVRTLAIARRTMRTGRERGSPAAQ
jgi:hypothetical protein